MRWEWYEKTLLKLHEGLGGPGKVMMKGTLCHCERGILVIALLIGIGIGPGISRCF